MSSQQDIDLEYQLLSTYRRTLSQLCLQAAQFGGESFVPPNISNGIHEARDNIWRIKNTLRTWGESVPDEPNDAPMSARSATAIYAAHQHLATLPLDRIPPPAALPLGSRMPYDHNPLFVGRSEDLLYLASVLKVGELAAIGQVAAATGLGGIGKTQLACEFVHRYGVYFSGGVYWLNFDDPEQIPSEIRECGGIGYMELRPDYSRLDPEDQIRLVRAAWLSGVPRLLVFDNCEDETLLMKWQPHNSGCRVLVTSRRKNWDVSLRVRTLALDVLQRKESIALLHKYRPDLAVDGAELFSVAAELGDLPLALHLAGSFLARYKHSVTPMSYLKELRNEQLLKHPSLQGRSLRQELSPTRHLQDIGRTFAISYERLAPTDKIDELARILLANAAHFEPGAPIPRSLLVSLVNVIEDPSFSLDAEDALNRLTDLGLLEVSGEDSLRLHRLLASFVRSITIDDDDVQSRLLQKFLVENKRYDEGKSFDERYARELFRRALVESKKGIWIRLCEHYSSRVENWVLNNLAIVDEVAKQDIIDKTFQLFHEQIGSDNFDEHTTLDSLLNSLENCCRTIINEYVAITLAKVINSEEVAVVKENVITMSIEEVYEHAYQEDIKQRLGQPADSKFGYELFRRAVIDQNDDAWRYIYLLYSPLIKRLIGRRANDDQIDGLISDAFTTFWSAMKPDRFHSLPTLSHVLSYLRQSIASAIRYEHRSVNTMPLFDISEAENYYVDDGNYLFTDASNKELWEKVYALLENEKERLVIKSLLINGFTTRYVYENYPKIFKSVNEIRAIRRNAIARLRENEQLLRELYL